MIDGRSEDRNGNLVPDECECSGDLDDDGDLDLIVSDSGSAYLGGAGGKPHLFFNDGAGVFSESAASLSAPTKASQMDVSFIDIDGDFDLDFYGTNRGNSSGGTQYLMLNNGSGVFTADPTAFVGTPAAATSAVA